MRRGLKCKCLQLIFLLPALCARVYLLKIAILAMFIAWRRELVALALHGSPCWHIFDATRLPSQFCYVVGELHYVVGELQSVGYIVGVFHLDSLLFALPARRERIYLLCFFRGTTEHLACARRFMEIFGRDNGIPNIKFFLVAPSEARLQQELDILLNGYYRSGRQVMACNPSKRRKWLTEHCNSAASSGNLDPFAGDQSIFECWPDLLSLTPRERDMLAVHGVAFPEDPPGRIAKISTSCSRLEFTDGAHIPTLTTRSRYYMTDLCRCVRGRELLRLQGIFALETATDVFTDKWMAEAAGNAFSAPVCLAAVLASMLARALCD